jgi:hypothetical protein
MVTPPYNLSALACARFPEARNNAQRGEKRSKSIRCEYDRRIEPPPHAPSGKKEYAKWRLAFTRPDVNEDGHDLFSKQSRADSNVSRIWSRLVFLVTWYASTYVPVEIDEVAQTRNINGFRPDERGLRTMWKILALLDKDSLFLCGCELRHEMEERRLRDRPCGRADD